MAAHIHHPLREEKSCSGRWKGSARQGLLHCRQGIRLLLSSARILKNDNCLTCCYPFSNEYGVWKVCVGFLNHHLLTWPQCTLPAPIMVGDAHKPFILCVFQLPTPFPYHTTSLPHNPPVAPSLWPFLCMVLTSTPPSHSVQLSQNPGGVCYLHVIWLAPFTPWAQLHALCIAKARGHRLLSYIKSFNCELKLQTGSRCFENWHSCSP